MTPPTTEGQRVGSGHPVRWSVDPKSYELAEHFAQGENLSEIELKELSQLIQDCCEDYFLYRHMAPADWRPACGKGLRNHPHLICELFDRHEGPCAAEGT